MFFYSTPAPQIPDSPESPIMEFPLLDHPPPPYIPLDPIDTVMQDLQFLEAREEVVKDLQSPDRTAETLKDLQALMDGIVSEDNNEACPDADAMDTTGAKCWSLQMGEKGPMVTNEGTDECQNGNGLTAQEALER